MSPYTCFYYLAVTINGSKCLQQQQQQQMLQIQKCVVCIYSQFFHFISRHTIHPVATHLACCGSLWIGEDHPAKEPAMSHFTNGSSECSLISLPLTFRLRLFTGFWIAWFTCRVEPRACSVNGSSAHHGRRLHIAPFRPRLKFAWGLSLNYVSFSAALIPFMFNILCNTVYLLCLWQHDILHENVNMARNLCWVYFW